MPTKTNKIELADQTPVITEFKQPETHKVIYWTDQYNDEYDLIDEPYEEQEETKTYKDFMREGFDPRFNDNQQLVYGLARTFEPKTKTILRMRQTIDQANQQLQTIINQPQQEPEQQSHEGEPNNEKQ